MLVLSRQIDETVLIGETIAVTVVSIGSESTTLHVRYRDARQRVEQKLALEIDDRLEITDEVHVHVVDICGDKVRLGVVAPNNMGVHRKEVYEAVKLKRKPESLLCDDPIRFHPTQRVTIGDSLHLHFQSEDNGRFALRCTGQLVGGAHDGQTVDRCESISIGSSFDFGTLVRVCVVEIAPETIALRIDHPLHMICRIEKSTES